MAASLLVLVVSAALRKLLSGLEQADSVAELEAAFLERGPPAFDAMGGALFRFGPRGEIEHAAVIGIPDEHVRAYLRLGPEADPVLAQALARRRPIHSAQLFAMTEWPETTFNRSISAEAAVPHYMAAPIFGPRGAIGSINLARLPDRPRFGTRDLVGAMVVAAQLSASLGYFSGRGANAAATGSSEVGDSVLTRRELQVADLVAEGFSNAGIAAVLAVSESYVKKLLGRAFAKVGAANRAELVAKRRR